MPGFEFELVDSDGGRTDLRQIRRLEEGEDPEEADLLDRMEALVRGVGPEGATVQGAVSGSGRYFGEKEARRILEILVDKGRLERGVERSNLFRFWASGLRPPDAGRQPLSRAKRHSRTKARKTRQTGNLVDF